MVTIQEQPKLNEVAAFIARMNAFHENHIGYCGKKTDEVLHTLEEDFTDVPAKQAFVAAIDEDQIVGVCGFDADLERGSAEIWGPFTHHTHKLEVSKLLWDTLLKKMPETIHKVSLFPDIHNKTVFEFASEAGFQSISNQTILTCTKGSLRELNDERVIPLTKDHFNSLANLHDKIFADTYLSGKEMVEGLSDESMAFGIIDKNKGLLGYLYAEAEPKFAEGSIEFFGVDPSARGRGMGSNLLTKGLEWLFSFESIKDISLCVRSDNAKAIHLYEKVGFQVEHQLTLLESKI